MGQRWDKSIALVGQGKEKNLKPLRFQGFLESSDNLDILISYIAF